MTDTLDEIIRKIHAEPIHKNLSKIPAAERISELEALVGQVLPTPYRSFLTRYGGYASSAYPSMAIAHEGKKRKIIVELFYGLLGDKEPDDIISRARDTLEMEDIPAGFLPIADCPSGDLVFLSLRADDEDSVWLWIHDSSSRDNFCRIAPTFTAFMHELYPLQES